MTVPLVCFRILIVHCFLANYENATLLPVIYDFVVAFSFWPFPSKLQLVQSEMNELSLTPHGNVFPFSHTLFTDAMVPQLHLTLHSLMCHVFSAEVPTELAMLQVSVYIPMRRSKEPYACGSKSTKL